MQKQIEKVCRAFNIKGKLISTKMFTNGHINSSYCAEFEVNGEIKKYLVQKINTVVFKNQEVLTQNIVKVTRHMRKKYADMGLDPKVRVLHFLKTTQGEYSYSDGESYWRIYNFIDNSHTYNLIENTELFEATGEAFGEFQLMLEDFDSSTLGETIPDFHNTAKRLEALKKAIELDPMGRKKEAEELIAFALQREADCSVMIDMLKNGELPLRVTHNDTKINNVLFDDESNHPTCIIDLDTVMPGLSLYDFGDAIRSGAAMSLENDPDVNKAGVNVELFEAYAKGYLRKVGSCLTEKEISLLAFSAKMMTFECGIRFLTDYLEGDKYFRISYPTENLDRTINQFAMTADIEKKMSILEEAVKKYS